MTYRVVSRCLYLHLTIVSEYCALVYELINAHPSNLAAWIMLVYIELHIWIHVYYDNAERISQDMGVLRG